MLPDIKRELQVVVPGHKQPELPQAGPRPLPADLLQLIAGPNFTLLDHSTCEVTPGQLKPRDAWLDLSSASLETVAMNFNVSPAWRPIEQARSDHNIIRFISLSYQALAATAANPSVS